MCRSALFLRSKSFVFEAGSIDSVARERIRRVVLVTRHPVHFIHAYATHARTIDIYIEKQPHFPCFAALRMIKLLKDELHRAGIEPATQ